MIRFFTYPVDTAPNCAKTCESTDGMKENGLLILQGGNSLNALETEDTVNSIMEAVKNIKLKRKDVNVAVTGVFPHTKESNRYEEMRRNINRRVQKEICEMKLALLKVKGGDVSYIDVDAVVSPDSFAKDGVHLNAEGDARVGRRILLWVKEKGRCQVSGP